MEIRKGKLIFYGDEIPVDFPPLYNQFLILLRDILGLEENLLSNVKLSYRDEEEEKIEIKSEEDYKVFMNDIQKGKQLAITIEVKEESNLDIKKCSSSIINYVAKKSGNINNLSEEIKKSSIKLDEENNIQNEKNLNLDENINNDFNIENKMEENSNQLIMNNNINNNKENMNNIDKNRNQDIIKQKEGNKNIQNNQQNNHINNINNQIPIQQNKEQNKFQIPQNINQNNNINNINQVAQNSNISQMSQNQNMNQFNASKLTNKYLYMISFPFACSLCRVGPIYRVMYFCKECNLVICERCEIREGEKHFHPLFKVQNGTQFQCLNINGLSTMDKIMDTMEGAYNSVLGFFGAGGNNSSNNVANSRAAQQQQVPQLVSNVQLARNIYDLRNVTDQQIEEALIKTRGNIDQAVFSLVPK